MDMFWGMGQAGKSSNSQPSDNPSKQSSLPSVHPFVRPSIHSSVHLFVHQSTKRASKQPANQPTSCATCTNNLAWPRKPIGGRTCGPTDQQAVMRTSAHRLRPSCRDRWRAERKHRESDRQVQTDDEVMGRHRDPERQTETRTKKSGNQPKT